MFARLAKQLVDRLPSEEMNDSTPTFNPSQIGRIIPSIKMQVNFPKLPYPALRLPVVPCYNAPIIPVLAWRKHARPSPVTPVGGAMPPDLRCIVLNELPKRRRLNIDRCQSSCIDKHSAATDPKFSNSH
jgi:hypothetical protein